MAVVIETTLGDIIVDLFVEQRPQACLNFIKLCKLKYYNFNLFHTIRNGFIAQTGDPTGEGSGGESIWGILEGPDKRYFSAETRPKIKHSEIGTVSMVCAGDGMIGSQFFITLAPDLDSLDGQHCVIGEVAEGHDILRKMNEVICDSSFRPYQDVRITHTIILEDPFSDPTKFREPSRSPSPTAARLVGGRIAPDEELDETKGKSAAEIAESIQEKEAKARATILEIVGDLPDADIAPPENVLFICKLNPVTTDEDLEIIFSRFGNIKSCEVIRDKKTGDSLQYAFIEFDNQKPCEDAYFKMDNVLIDDRRIHVDFSQSVSKLKWRGKGRGVINLDSKQENSAYNHRPVRGGRQHADRLKNQSKDETHNERNKLRNENYSRKEKYEHHISNMNDKSEKINRDLSSYSREKRLNDKSQKSTHHSDRNRIQDDNRKYRDVTKKDKDIKESSERERSEDDNRKSVNCDRYGKKENDREISKSLRSESGTPDRSCMKEHAKRNISPQTTARSDKRPKVEKDFSQEKKEKRESSKKNNYDRNEKDVPGRRSDLDRNDRHRNDKERYNVRDDRHKSKKDSDSDRNDRHRNDEEYHDVRDDRHKSKKDSDSDRNDRHRNDEKYHDVRDDRHKSNKKYDVDRNDRQRNDKYKSRRDIN